MKKSLSFTILGVLVWPAILPSVVFSEEFSISQEQITEGATSLDRAIPRITVRFISPFRYLDHKVQVDQDGKPLSVDSKNKDNPLMTVTSELNPIVVSSLIGELGYKEKEKLSLQGDPQPEDAEGLPGNLGLTRTFAKGFNEAMNAMKYAEVRGEGEGKSILRGLCAGPRISRAEDENGEPIEDKVTEDLEKRLKDCANHYPAEYTVAVNYFQTFTTWKTKETEALFDYYIEKSKSKRFVDRIESRLMIDCLSNAIGTGSILGKGSVFQVPDDFELSEVDQEVYKDIEKRYTQSYESGEPNRKYQSGGSSRNGGEIYRKYENGEDFLEGRVYEIHRRPETLTGVESASALARCTVPYYWNLGSIFNIADLASCSMTDLSEEDKKDESAGSILTFDKYEEEGNEHKNLDDVNVVFVERSSNKTVNYAFDFPTYIQRCVMTKHRAIMNEKSDKLPTGTRAAISMIPFTRLELVKGNMEYIPETEQAEENVESGKYSKFAQTNDEKSVIFRIKTYPMTVSADEVYSALRMRVLRFISSANFIQGVTDGWIPSPFAPDDLDFNKDAVSKNGKPWKDYCSIRLPIRLMQQINQFSNSLAKAGQDDGSDIDFDEIQHAEQRVTFAWKLIADRVALLQTLEVMLGAVQIAQESERMLGILDKDLHQLIEPSYQFLKIVVDGYKSSIDLSYTTTIEDILKKLESFREDYEKVKDFSAMTRKGAEELEKQYLEKFEEIQPKAPDE